jgi:hypothetical protein
MTTPQQPAAEAAPTSRPRRRWRRMAIFVLVVPILLFTLYTWFVLHWDYSNGYRSGTMQKFSRKGWVCKTDEGELWQSEQTFKPTIWFFTVRDPSVARQMDTLVGKSLRLHYTEHRGVPTSCFGETRFYVDSVVVVSP